MNATEHEFAFFEAAQEHLPWLDPAGVERALAYVTDRHLYQRERWVASMARLGRRWRQIAWMIEVNKEGRTWA